MGAVNDRLAEIAQQMQEQSAKGAVPTPHEITPRELVRLYGYERRGASVNSRIRNDLEQVNLRVVPDFEFQYTGLKDINRIGPGSRRISVFRTTVRPNLPCWNP